MAADGPSGVDFEGMERKAPKTLKRRERSARAVNAAIIACAKAEAACVESMVRDRPALKVRAIHDDPISVTREVLIPLPPVDALLAERLLRDLHDFRKRAFKRLGAKDGAASVTAVEYRMEGNTLVVRVLQGMLG